MKNCENFEIFRKIAKKLLKDSIILPEELDIISYGLDNLGNNVLSFLLVLVIGGAVGHLRDSFIFLCLIFPLRKYSGGFHAETKERCSYISIGILIISFIIFFKLEWKVREFVAITLVCSSIIFLLVPVDSINKPLDSLEYRVYQKRAKLVLVNEILLFGMALYVKCKEILIIIAMCFFIISISLFAGKLKYE